MAGLELVLCGARQTSRSHAAGDCDAVLLPPAVSSGERSPRAAENRFLERLAGRDIQQDPVLPRRYIPDKSRSGIQTMEGTRRPGYREPSLHRSTCSSRQQGEMLTRRCFSRSGVVYVSNTSIGNAQEYDRSSRCLPDLHYSNIKIVYSADSASRCWSGNDCAI